MGVKALNEILEKYKSGEYTVDETNDALENANSDFRIDPNNGVILPSEMKTHGLLDTGTGTFNKVEIRDGKMVDNNIGDMYAICFFDGKAYHVKGDTLVGYGE